MFLGAKTPHVLRKCSEECEDASYERYLLVGDAYLHGFMDGTQLTSLAEHVKEIRII